MLTVACVNVNNYLGRGKEYVDKLRSMVKRNLSQPFEFVCITESDKAGWWAKIDLFEPGRFTGRVLYIDLDSVITGPLDVLVESKGIIDLTQWAWWTPFYCSAVMVWDAGEHSEIWTEYTPDVPKLCAGDQDWMTHLGGWNALPDGMVRSNKYHCKFGPPPGCVVVQFHGPRKPHEFLNGWVEKLWV